MSPSLLNGDSARALRKHPSLILHAIKGKPELHIKLIALELDSARRLYEGAKSEYQNIVGLQNLLGIFKKEMYYHTAVLYPICRYIKPDVAVETGVHYGASSAFILQALEDNKKGHLYSIDLPNFSYKPDQQHEVVTELIPESKTTGFVVPSSLRKRWTLILGDSKEKLPSLVEEIGGIDVFHHDSLHSYDHMRFEFEMIWEKLRDGGLLTSDDATWNSAFSDFCKEKEMKNFLVEGTGIAIKNVR